MSPAEAAKVYEENCRVCHGDGGDGQTRARFGLNPQPRDFTTAGAAAELNRERMISSVVQGREGTAMVAWKDRLSMAQIEGVVDYIRTNFMPLAPAEEALATTDPRLQLGRQIYEQNCRVCHGDRGNGATWTNSVLNPPPRNFTSPQARRILTRKRMLASVTFGRKQTAMMPFATRLSDDEIGAVVDYIREVFMKGPVVADAGMTDLSGQGAMGGHAGGGHPRAPSSIGAHGMAPGMAQSQEPVAEVDMSAGFAGELKGDFARGRRIYLNNCSTCHGVRGDGLGPRSSFIQPKPRNFLHVESRTTLNRPALFRAIGIGKPGTVMPAWSKVLSAQQIADVAEFVFQDFIHPNPDDIEPRVDLDMDADAAPMADKKKAP
ncbi:hypothetical protein Tel_16675 [Candidatus Tenderia electrophaga]|uniref:Cytochrome c domain-containing protein n=1 Tax=Candidatus Tenderia electrophaga TaxID=1748243 RepID=A0A0S2THK8_9GAMM|nr:hypothetical protein Tel_16675 [Candidatus Tenderia electrophaga]